MSLKYRILWDVRKLTALLLFALLVGLGIVALTLKRKAASDAAEPGKVAVEEPGHNTSNSGSHPQPNGDGIRKQTIEDWYYSATARSHQADPRIGTQSEKRRVRTASRIAAFIETGELRELRAISNTEARQFAEFMAGQFDREEIAGFAKSFGAIPEHVIPYSQDQIGEFLYGWFRAVRGNEPEKPETPAPIQQPMVDIAFTSTMSGPVGSAAFFQTGVNSIYGMFENRARTAGLGQVVAIWKDLSADRVLFQETEPIHVASDFNYVWLNLPSGWKPGQCRLELFDPQNAFANLAAGEFTIE